ncbi:MAG: response regulator, partial [Bacteroidota bacterium]
MKIKILVVEDNVITLDELEYLLVEMGYEVETAVSGDEGIKKADSFNPDIILSDINLGDGIDGVETINHINQTQNIPVIYITAYDDDSTLNRARITEPYAYIIKPVQKRKLSIAISVALYKSKTEKELRELNALKNKFFSLIAHDLTGPFASVAGLSDLLVKNFENFSKDEIKQHIGLINDSSQQAHRLVNNLLQWSRSQLNGIVVTKQKTRLLPFVDKV